MTEQKSFNFFFFFYISFQIFAAEIYEACSVGLTRMSWI